MKNYKSIFQSKTFWGSIGSVGVALWFALVPQLERLADENRKPTTKEWINIISLVVGTLTTSGLTIVGRVQAKDNIYTPSYLPGPNKPENENQSPQDI